MKCLFGERCVHPKSLESTQNKFFRAMTSTQSKITQDTWKQHNISQDQQQTTETNLYRLAALELSDMDDNINYAYYI